ncbi:diphosphomevalonate/mevalonate 3,5-bisphosphate decarboxylase family protein [Flagellimonas meridianipacifica]|uniref:Diphosphomevalonate decarboxylase n=1 Tax=Flagellimonas meridianipacifica TaxID=1080225 RepID=A0A2T0MFY7_9FLAO|nr:diphosphomevalonate decarboxylase [Allomuricauda pacifica]PRX56475.1 diphosphomevalonate decarboxylase [Allomuricauda pacifica]
MTETEFIPKAYTNFPEKGKVGWKAPSNIALVKYWGKKANQIPANPSISFTLDVSATITQVSYTKKKVDSNGFSFDLLFEGKPKEDFKPKIQTFLERIEPYLPFLKKYHFVIETSNSFPHSSGIASSASGMSALALCFLSIESKIQDMELDFFKKKASFLARLGSGSACRSIEGDLVQWGHHQGLEMSSDLYGIKYPFVVDPIFKNYQDTILLVHKGQKQVGSTVGHNLMHDHPYAEKRFEQAHLNLDKLKPILEEGDLQGFMQLVESEALTLHAMMMTSMPYFILMMPDTLEIINKLWRFRKETNVPICFTLDAGANVHVLYPESVKEKAIQFIKDELVAHCENGHYICDQIGTGAKQLFEE